MSTDANSNQDNPERVQLLRSAREVQLFGHRDEVPQIP